MISIVKYVFYSEMRQNESRLYTRSWQRSSKSPDRLPGDTRERHQWEKRL